jgi:hypothetical protein
MEGGGGGGGGGGTISMTCLFFPLSRTSVSVSEESSSFEFGDERVSMSTAPCPSSFMRWLREALASRSWGRNEFSRERRSEVFGGGVISGLRDIVLLLDVTGRFSKYS